MGLIVKLLADPVSTSKDQNVEKFRNLFVLNYEWPFCTEIPFAN